MADMARGMAEADGPVIGLAAWLAAWRASGPRMRLAWVVTSGGRMLEEDHGQGAGPGRGLEPRTNDWWSHGQHGTKDEDWWSRVEEDPRVKGVKDDEWQGEDGGCASSPLRIRMAPKSRAY